MQEWIFIFHSLLLCFLLKQSPVITASTRLKFHHLIAYCALEAFSKTPTHGRESELGKQLPGSKPLNRGSQLPCSHTGKALLR